MEGNSDAGNVGKSVFTFFSHTTENYFFKLQ